MLQHVALSVTDSEEIENCPMQAIELVNGKAFINESECDNCRLCESQCTVGAIS